METKCCSMCGQDDADHTTADECRAALLDVYRQAWEQLELAGKLAKAARDYRWAVTHEDASWVTSELDKALDAYQEARK